MDIPAANTIRIKDLGLAAALVSLGLAVLRTEWDSQGRAYFVFEQTKELGQAVDGYWANTLDVKARYYFDSVKMLKSRIYDGQ